MGTERILKVDSTALKSLEAYINSEEDAGQLLAALGILTSDELAAAIHKMEDFRVKVELDPALAEEKAKELDETGRVSEIVAAEEG